MIVNKRFFPALIGFLLAHVAISQVPQPEPVQLINSGEVIKQAVVLYDSGRYEEAAKLYQTVPQQDTNYVYMLSELALTLDALKEYDKGIKTCRTGLQVPSEFRSQFYRLLGTIYDHKGEYDSSVLTYKHGLGLFPYDYSLHFNLGITYYNHHEYDKASECFFNTLKLNPYHGGSHLNLGRLAAFQGKKVRALMSMGIYMSLAEKDNERLVFVERLSNNEIKDEGTIAFTGDYPFEKLDQLIRARIVNDKNFKPKVPLNAMLVKQYQLLFDQLDLADTSIKDFWMEFYLPLFKDFRSKQMLEPFLYHILTSSTFADVKKWKKKNEKRLNAFYEAANSGLRSWRSEVNTDPAWGMGDQAPASFSSNKLESIGKKVNGVEAGKWRYYFSNGELASFGEFDNQGKKVGTWTYYYSTGQLKKLEAYSGNRIDVQNFTEFGEPKNRYQVVDDKVDGEVEIYYPCGKVRERLTYVKGLREGPGKVYYIDGPVSTEYKFKADKHDGNYVNYYPDGTVSSSYIYKDGNLEGDYVSYYYTGKLRSKGSYSNNEADGHWMYYYPNGRLEKEGDYLKDKVSGNWTFYNSRGEKEEEKTVIEDQIHGELIQYTRGTKAVVTTYDHGKVLQMVHYDNTGKEIGRCEDPKGNFPCTGYNYAGAKVFEGAFKDGKRTGTWKYYFKEGMLKSEYSFLEGELHGDYREYFKNGQLKVEKHFANGNLDGLYREYYINGVLKQQGWYSDDQPEQTWYMYQSDGLLDSEDYFLKGESTGATFDFNVDGKPYSRVDYRNDLITRIEYYTKTGAIRMQTIGIGDKVEVAQKYANGSIQSTLEMDCGYYGGIERYLQNGKKALALPALYGKRHGHYEYSNLDGSPSVEGDYVAGDEVGKWIWYHKNGKINTIGFYLEGERDSLWTYFDDKGKISAAIPYIQGERNGVSTYFASDGTAYMEKDYLDGGTIAYRFLSKGVMSEWQPYKPDASIIATLANGQKIYEEHHRMGLLDGVESEYYPNGQLEHQYHYVLGDLNGPYVYYYTNGKVKEKGTYKNDELDGVVQHFDQNGKLTTSEGFKMGVRQGKTIFSDGTEVNYWGGFIDE